MPVIILNYIANGVPQPLRLAAIRAIGGISTGQTPGNLERILDRLSDLSAETFFLTQVAVASALGQMETPKAIGILQSLAEGFVFFWGKHRYPCRGEKRIASLSNCPNFL